MSIVLAVDLAAFKEDTDGVLDDIPGGMNMSFVSGHGQLELQFVGGEGTGSLEVVCSLHLRLNRDRNQFCVGRYRMRGFTAFLRRETLGVILTCDFGIVVGDGILQWCVDKIIKYGTYMNNFTYTVKVREGCNCALTRLCIQS